MLMRSVREIGSDPAPRLLIVDRDESNVAWLIDNLLGKFRIHREVWGPQLVAIIDTLAPVLIVVGTDSEDLANSDWLAALEDRESLPILYLSAHGDPTCGVSALQHLHRHMTSDDLLQRINEAIAGDKQLPAVSTAGSSPTMSRGEAAGIQRLLEVAREFGSQTDLAGASRVLQRTLLEFLKADRAYCLFYSASDESLWTATDNAAWSVAREFSSRQGLAGDVARTGTTVRIEEAALDPRYDKASDDPQGVGNEHIIAHPLRDPAQEVHAVLLAIRSGDKELFSEHDEGICHWLTDQLAPLTAQLIMQLEVASVLKEAQEQPLFREEAAIAYANIGKKGDVVRVSPPWIGWAYWALVMVMLMFGALLVSAELPNYSSGPMVLTESGRTEVFAPVAGSIESIDVRPGQRIVAGQRLATFYAPEENSQLTRLDLEWQSSIRSYLANRADQGARSAVSSLRLQRDQLLDKLTLRAPHGGIVNDLQVVSGQHTERGDGLLSISQPGERLGVIAFLPGADRPQLQVGMTLRMTLQGYPRNHVDLVIESVSKDVMGRAEASRALGHGLADSVQLPASAVVVRAALLERSFKVDGESYQYSHGMLGLAEVKLRSEPAIRTLIPALGRR